MPPLTITPGHTEKNYWHDVWKYRELFYFLTLRDILVRYKQTIIGLAWALVRPLLTMCVFTVVFGGIAKLPSPNDVPYSLLVFAGMLPWQFFATALGESSNSLVGNASLITKVYFPRIIIPAGSVITSFVDFMITLGFMVALTAWYHVLPDWRCLLLPGFLALAFCGAFGAGLWFSALNVRYRDFRYIVPFIVQFGLYVSPVGFASGIVPERWRLLYSLNPMVGVIDGFRWSLLRGKTTLSITSVAMSCALVALLTVSGLRFFRRTERTFADII